MMNIRWTMGGPHSIQVLLGGVGAQPYSSEHVWTCHHKVPHHFQISTWHASAGRSKVCLWLGLSGSDVAARLWLMQQILKAVARRDRVDILLGLFEGRYQVVIAWDYLLLSVEGRCVLDRWVALSYITTLVPEAGLWFNIKMSSYQYGKSHCGDKTVVRPSYLHNGISYTGKMTSLYWIRPMVSRTWISNYTPHNSVGCNYLPMP